MRLEPLQVPLTPTTLPSVADKLHRDNLQTAEAVLSLGLTVVRELHENSVATVFLNQFGQVEVCPAGELELDGVDEGIALSTLLERGYQDEQLVAYLMGRKTREARRG